MHLLWDEFLRLRRFNTLIRSWRVSGEEMLSSLDIPFRSHRRTSIGNALFSFVRSHVTCVSKPRKQKMIGKFPRAEACRRYSRFGFFDGRRRGYSERVCDQDMVSA